MQVILTSNLNMQSIAAKFMPRLLISDQEELRAEICQDLYQNVLDDLTFMSRVITGDETWVYGYDPETKQKSSQWKIPTFPRPKKARPRACSTFTSTFACKLTGVRLQSSEASEGGHSAPS